MKKIILCTILSCLCLFTLKAQHEDAGADSATSVKIKAGFLLVPLAEISLEDMSDGFAVNTSLSFVLPIIMSEKLTFIPLYDFTFNQAGMTVEYSLSDNFLAYGLGKKNVYSEGGYSGIGVAKPIAKGRALAVVELGASWKEKQPFIFTGLLIPFTLTLKE